MAVRNGYPCSVTASKSCCSSELKAESNSTEESWTVTWEPRGREGARGTLKFKPGDWRENNNSGLESQFPRERRRRRRRRETLHCCQEIHNRKMYSDTLLKCCFVFPVTCASLYACYCYVYMFHLNIVSCCFAIK